MENTKTHSYKDLLVWHKAIELSVAVYATTEKLPREEIYGLTSQMRRAAVSIGSNIAEGRMRGTRNDYIHFLQMAYGSAAELDTQIEIAKKLPHLKNIDWGKTEGFLGETLRMLGVMISRMKAL